MKGMAVLPINVLRALGTKNNAEKKYTLSVNNIIWSNTSNNNGTSPLFTIRSRGVRPSDTSWEQQN